MFIRKTINISLKKQHMVNYLDCKFDSSQEKVIYFQKKEANFQNHFKQQVQTLKILAIKETLRNVHMTHAIVNSYEGGKKIFFSMLDTVALDCAKIKMFKIPKSLISDLMLHRIFNNLFFLGCAVEIIASNFNIKFEFGLELASILRYYTDIFNFEFSDHTRYCFILCQNVPKSKVGFMITNIEGNRTIFKQLFANSFTEINYYMHEKMSTDGGVRQAIVCADRILPFIDPLISDYDKWFYMITYALPLPESYARVIFLSEDEKI